MKIISNILIGIIKIYQMIISPYLTPSCRYLPTCSSYFIESLEKHGAVKGSFLGMKRVLSCHPIKMLGGGEGFDPVDEKIKVKK